MGLRLKGNVILLAVTALLAVSCNPKALIKDQSGATISVKNFKSSNAPLIIRFNGGRANCSFKSLSSFTINPSIRETYEGIMWIRIEYTLKKDKSSTKQIGWIPQLSQINATSLTGKCKLDLVNISEVDFTMGKKNTPSAANATDSTGTTNPSADSTIASDSAATSTDN